MPESKEQSRLAGSQSFRPDIEGLRAIAVLGVVAFHFGLNQLPGGFAGVDIFFVISGYLITSHLQNEIAKRGTVDLWRFYARRARRLLPASLLVILITLLVGYFVLSPSEQQLYSKGALYASAYVINLWLIRWSLDYFAPDAADNPFIHFWSLSVEEQFYLAWPALLLLFAWLRPGKRGLAIQMGLVAAVSFAACAWLTTVSQPWAFYFSPFRAWEFAAGGLISLAVAQPWAREFRASPVLGWAGLVLIAVAYLTLSEEGAFPGIAALLPVVGTAIVILAGARQVATGPNRWLGNPVFQWVGKLSYSLYLWHWPVIVYATILKPELTLADRLGCLLLTFALSMLTYHLVENPIRRNGWLTARSRRSLGFAAMLTAMGVTVAYGSAGLAGSHVDSQQLFIQKSAERKSAAREAGSSCVSTLEIDEPVACELGDGKSQTTVVLFGDSHADHWSSPLAKIAREKGWRLVTYLKGACPAARVTVWSATMKRKFDECDRWRETAMRKIISLDPALVVVSQFSHHYVENDIEDNAYHPLDVGTWVEGVKSSLDTLRNAGIEVVLLRDVPLHKLDVSRCVQRALWQERGAAVCDTPRSQALDDRVYEAEKAAAAEMGIPYVDTSGMFCDDRKCSSMIDGRLTYRDRQHIAAPYAESLAPSLERAVFPRLEAREVRR
ncbi:acyltransferase family protein [Mesorhizobium sp. 1B3]|uniref:acyltransferase family protein n=1 Tax=Mesorhizobium sp. 1B3 TaxID=3243599 RepID=UPI003D973B4D